MLLFRGGWRRIFSGSRRNVGWALKSVKEGSSPLLILNVGPEGESSECSHDSGDPGNRSGESPFTDDY